jgi:Protein of unknown function (DUF3383)
MSLSVDQVVDVEILLSSPAPTARGFGTKLIMGKATVLPLYARVKEYADLTELVVDFVSSTEEYKAAAIHFGQNPRPKKVKIGRQFLGAQAGQLRGGVASSTIGDYTGVTNGGFDITINGTNRQIFALDLSGAANMAAVATLIQTKLAAALASTTCVWDATLLKFVITSPTTGTASIVLPAVAPTGGSSPTDVTTLLAFSVSAGAKSVNGIATETMTAAWDAAAIFDPDFYFATVTAAMSVQDKKDSGDWALSNVREFFYTTNDPNALTLNDTGNLGYYFKNEGNKRAFGEYNGASPYAAESASARAGVVDFDQPNSTITLMYKQQPGVAVDNLTSGQVAALKTYNLNYYIDRGGISVLETGVMADGTFQDEVHGLDWFTAGLQNAIFALLATTPTKIPQTDEGATKIIAACNGFSEKARTNGLVAKGTWKGDAFGELKTGDFMPTGYYFTAGAVADMSQADKDARKSPPITGAILLAGAIHTVSVQITVQR